MKKKFIFLNGTFIPAEKAIIPIQTHGFQYGTWCFGGIRAYYSQKDNCLYAFRMKEHYERLKKSAHVLYIEIPYSIEELCILTQTLLQKNYTKHDVYIRPFAYKSDLSLISFNLPTLQNGFGVFTLPLGRFTSKPEGIRANISSWTRISDNSIPPRAKIMGSYVNTALAKTESHIGGYDEAIFLDKNGHVLEGSAENIFIVLDNTIYTPPSYDDILQGITRSTISELVQKELGLMVKEQSMNRTQLYQADEVFLVGTGAEVLPVIQIDGRNIGNGRIGDITKQIQKIYTALVRGEIKAYSSWLTKVQK